MHDLFNDVAPVSCITPAGAVADSTPLVGAVIDRQGFSSLTFLILTGVLADADATFSVLIEHDDDSGFGSAEAVSDTELLGTEALAGFTFADDNAVRKIGYRGAKRYVRLTVTPANNTGNAFVAAVAVKGHPHTAPTANPPA